MIAPGPRALLVEHPALPRLSVGPAAPSETVAVSKLGDRDRLAVALQLVAATALLADFDLWPGRSALRSATIRPTASGPRAVLSSWPLPLSPLLTRLGNGPSAVSASMTAALHAVADATAIESDLLAPPPTGRGFAYEPVIARLLDELGSAIDDPTARALWMLRWTMPPEPGPGETVLYTVRDADVALRLGAAVYRSTVRRGIGARLEIAPAGAAPLELAAADAPISVHVVVGSPTEGLLADRLRCMDRIRASLLVLGTLPPGWTSEPPPVLDGDRIATHISVVGISPARRVRFLDRLNQRFDPTSFHDRQRLTQCAAGLFRGLPQRGAPSRTDLGALAGLAPEGVPVDLATRLSGAAPNAIAAAERAGTVELRDGRVALAEPPALRVDPRHGEVAETYAASDPRRLLHRALADGNPGPLLHWARGRLDDLDGRSVRGVLAPVEPGALGPGVDAALAEACLGLADIAGARRAISRLDDAMADPWRSWMTLLDRIPGFEVELPGPADLAVAPRACAEIGLVGVRRGLWRRGRPPAEPLELVRAAEPHLSGPCRRWIGIRLTAKIDPHLLDDGEWRRDVTRGHPELVGLVLFERAFRAMEQGEHRLAIRLFEHLIARESSPGRLAPMLITLGGLLADRGQTDRAVAATRRARDLFLAAGSRHRLLDAVHNLAVADLDALQVERARQRLAELARAGDQLFVEVERTRLDLAVGDLERFSTRLDGLPSIDGVAAPPLVEALSFLHGAAALLSGDPAGADELLAAGGREAQAWRALTAAVSGRDPPEVPSEDAWGIGAAASRLRRLRAARPERRDTGIGEGEWTVRRALGAAVLRHLGVRVDTADPSRRAVVARVLEAHGLTGWARRVRWNASDTESMLIGLSRMLDRSWQTPSHGSEIDDVLRAVGVTGVILRRVKDRSVLFRAGVGDELESTVRGRVELVPLGAPPTSHGAWMLLFNVLESWAPLVPADQLSATADEVRVDGVSPAVEELRREVLQTAPTGLPVLIVGETGTGKEVAARELHRLSRRAGELVAVNIAEIPGSLLESELFGAVKGAFTGAERSRVGLVRSADGGTLFLDEIGDLDGTLQVKLLRFLESGEVRPVGSDRVVRVDVRVVCATHRNLERLVRRGRFREDLYYRIAVARVTMPALRNRLEDIRVLAVLFGREAADRYGLPEPTWTTGAHRALLAHDWPGNIRELKHTVEVAMARAGSRSIGPEHLGITATRRVPRGTWNASLTEFKQRLLTEVLTRHAGNRTRAARELGISRQALLYQIKKLGLDEL
jgi:transcriptional regulator with AAA-type ATPase domain